MQSWALLSLEAKRILFPHCPWRTTVSSRGETQATLLLLMVLRWFQDIGHSQQVQEEPAATNIQRRQDRDLTNKRKGKNTEVINKSDKAETLN